jgi:NTE family protein
MNLLIPPLHIVLGGGGVKCLAYIGAFQELESNNFLKTIQYFHGVSAGAFMCFVYILGYSLKELYQIGKSLDFSLIQNIDENFPFELFQSFGFDNGAKLEKLIETFLKHKGFNREITFEQLYALTKKHLIFYAVDIHDKKLKQFSFKTTPNTTILFALRSSMSLPGYFTPMIDISSNHYYVDGALINNYPIDLIDLIDCETVLGINFKDDNRSVEKIESIQSYFYQLFSCLYNTTMEISDNAKEKTIYINCKSSTLDFYATEEQRIEIMESGRESVKQFLKKKKSFQKRRNSL